MSAKASPADDHEGDAVALVPFAESHLEGALALSRELAWPYRLEDWALALQLGRGFVLQRGGAVIGTAAWWAHGDAHASAGMVIIARSAQGRGHGARLMDALLAAAHPRSITLNSTTEGLALYERRGFVRVGEVRQHQGVVASMSPPAPLAAQVRALAPTDAAVVARLDHEATGWARQAMLDRLAETGEGHVLVRDSDPRGYAISRPFGRGYVIGPVVADNAETARALILTALARLDGCFVRVDTPASSQLGSWLETIGLPTVGGATTMVRAGDTAPALPTGPAQLFALANQSFN